MARPKKTDSDEMLAMVDSFFTTEAAGNPLKLKCSMLEEYAARLGKQIKAYDFRRDEKVRQRIEELKTLVKNENGMGIQLGNPYKDLDVTRIMKARRDPDELRTVLGELDSYWRYVYESTLKIRKDAETVAAQKKHFEEAYKVLLHEKESLRKSNEASRSEIRRLIVENRYLRKMLRTYLYPALANEILVDEKQMKDTDTEVVPLAREKLVDGKLPSAFGAAFADDRRLLTREEELLKQMWNSVSEEML